MRLPSEKVRLTLDLCGILTLIRRNVQEHLAQNA
jgi:hypothetical protein